ncbi:DUF2800 domain-containing protein [Paenibacillus melissococcoides]|uniref:DUF2800 domain-containing protein n=1 Tax=Paenibacillus melissococcoides TaxID=2912268 RepID=A0ABM9G0K2_9BACL|nr:MULTISPECIES: DUF2800 domain-containing protein [Paenibacillus]CAH8245113.1 DUF2800 domain-containing protein [Paenibacillus melissococcoides]CAH8249202.1 DUF2800 domain-containing protein [Paenibacillus melissococcoides]CAH8709943.1 DUF2800 domain-containing protein [Paenibacillus melissococcoides]CAH8710670.1 DUF2800 domain-containing protein [Paenibacillus melissococcoides]GIO81189.1 hypothetical protein J6TS7_47990 [Paenibacillus dendritiformis]
MTQPAHVERAHALLSASGAERWINCPPSARLCEKIPDKRSEYADEGTAAHELSELKLRRRIIPCNSAERRRLDAAIEKFKTNEYYGPEMENAVQDYIELVEERFMEAKARSSDAVVLLEERLDFTEWVPMGYGTGDVVLISDGVLEVIDLKYGKGVPVSAVGNAQLRLYGLGAWSAHSWLYDIKEVCMTIVQPRLDSVSTDTMPIDELIEWAEIVVKPAAALAYAGEGGFKAGSHCRWCKVKGNCRARADENMKALVYEFQDPALLSNEEIGSILFVAEQLQAWAKDVADYAFEQAKVGKRIPQWKLVEGRSNRVISDKDVAWKTLEEANLEPDKYLKPRELRGIGELEKRIGKKELAKLLDELIIKPPGKPVLVPETDPRAELNSLEDEFADVGFEV